MRVDICGTGVDPYSFREVIELICAHIKTSKTPQYIVTPNAQHIVLVRKDALFRQLYRQAWLVVPDGVPLLWSAKLLKTPLNGRVNGTDLFEALCAVAAEQNFRVFFLGGRPGAAEGAKAKLEIRHPNLQVVGTSCPPFGFENSQTELEKIKAEIHQAQPDILFLGLGTPKQEKWIYEHYQELQVPISIGIGGSFDLVSGMLQRAPKWMQKSGLEWLFRLTLEPGRLWQRYFESNTQFVWLVMRQVLGTLKPLP